MSPGGRRTSRHSRQEHPIATPDPFEEYSAQRQTQRNQRRCVLCNQLIKLPPEKIAQTVKAIENHKITQTAIVHVLGTWDIKTSATVVREHRFGNRGRTVCMKRLKELVRE